MESNAQRQDATMVDQVAAPWEPPGDRRMYKDKTDNLEASTVMIYKI